MTYAVIGLAMEFAKFLNGSLSVSPRFRSKLRRSDIILLFSFSDLVKDDEETGKGWGKGIYHPGDGGWHGSWA